MVDAQNEARPDFHATQAGHVRKDFGMYISRGIHPYNTPTIRPRPTRFEEFLVRL